MLRSSNGLRKWQQLTGMANGNGRTATEWWKLGISRHLYGIRQQCAVGNAHTDLHRTEHKADKFIPTK